MTGTLSSQFARLTVLYASHLLQSGDKEGAVRTLAAGVCFSRDVANGGTLFATLIAKNLIATHIRGIAFAEHVEHLSAVQKNVLQKALSQLGPAGLDWESGVRREFEVLAPGLDAKASLSRRQIASAHQSVLDNPSTLPKLQQMIASAPQSVQTLIPNPRRVLDERQDLAEQLRQIRFLLQ